MEITAEIPKEYGIKQATFGHSPLSVRDVACVDFKGFLDIYDLEKGKVKYHV